MDLLENLNKEQLKAVTHEEGPLLIVAGAGTGKTTVITQRIAYLIEQGKASSQEILALTFTEKSAGEMEERVDRLLPLGYLDLWISTFHSFGERILHAHGTDIGLSTDFRLLNEFEQWALVKKNLDKFDLDYYRPLGNPTKFIHALVKHFSRAKDEDISPKEYLAYAEELKQNQDAMLSGGKKKISNFEFLISNIATHNGKVDKEMLAQEIERVNEVANAYHTYQQLLLDNNALDFGDLINYCLKLFRERPAILKNYQQQFKYILLDEFQDTNWAQYELIKLLAAPNNNLVVVGDDDQSIYKFRGASVSNILQFKKDFPKALELVLVKNYRNKQNILDLTYEFIQLNNPNRLEYQLNKKQHKKEISSEASELISKASINKKLIAQEKGKGVIEVIEGQDLNDEVRKVVEKIADLKIGSRRAATNGANANKKAEEASWNDFAILVRANDSAKDFTNALDIAGLPYQFLASRGLYAKPVIMDVVAYLRMLDNYHESPALYRILNLPVFNFSYQELVNFNYWAKKKTWSLYEVLKSVASLKLGADIQAKVNEVLNLIAKHTALVRDKTATEIVMAFLHDSGYLKYLTAKDEHSSREITGYLNQFLKRIQTFEASSDEKSVKTFLEDLNLEIDAGEQGALLPDLEAGPEAIKIMTVHGAKGLEFKYVFLPNLVDRRFPTIERKEPIMIPEALIKEILPEGDVHLQEERRLFYVAMTRAKAGVWFSWAGDYGGKRKKKPSRFLDECNLIKEHKADTDSKKEQTALLEVKESESIARTDGVKLNLPSYFSYTQLAAFTNCPYQYRFAHVLKVPRKGKFTLSYGQSMHLTLQRLFTLINEKRGLGQGNLFSEPGRDALHASQGQKASVKINFDEIEGIYEQSWIDDWYDSSKQKNEYKKKGKDSLKKYYEKHKDNWPMAKSLEQGINFKLNGYSIFGKLDRIDDLGRNGLGIVDYKTGSPKSSDKLTSEDKEQLLLYQIGATETFSEEIKNLQFYYLDNNSEVDFLGKAADISEMKEKTIEKIKRIETAFKTNSFPPKPGPLCKFCDFNSICEFRKL